VKALSIWSQAPGATEPETPVFVRVQLVREAQSPYGSARLRDSLDAGDMAAQLIGDAPREVFLAFLLDTKHRINAIHRVSEGRIDSCPAGPREVFQAAIIANARCLILAHNHPSGDPEPSARDLAITRRLCAAGRLLGIGVLDHLVIGQGRNVTLRGRRPELEWGDLPSEDVGEGREAAHSTLASWRRAGPGAA